MIKKCIFIFMFCISCHAMKKSQKNEFDMQGRLMINKFEAPIGPQDEMYLRFAKELSAKGFNVQGQEVLIPVFVSNEQHPNWGTKNISLFYKDHPQYLEYTMTHSKQTKKQAFKKCRFPLFIPYSLINFYQEGNQFGLSFCGKSILLVCNQMLDGSDIVSFQEQLKLTLQKQE